MNFSRADQLVEHAKALKVSAGTEPDADLGPVISKQVIYVSDISHLLHTTICTLTNSHDKVRNHFRLFSLDNLECRYSLGVQAEISYLF